MKKRVTVILDDEIIKKLRTIQAKQIAQSSGHVSFSNVIEEKLRKAIK